MRLSLYILADWLERYHPVCSITEGKRTIRNVRMFSDEHSITANNVYVSRVGGSAGGVLCIHGNDYLFLDAADENQVINDIMDALDFYNDWSDRLKQALGTLSLEEILRRSDPVLGTMLMVADASYHILAHTNRSDILSDRGELRSIVDREIMDIDMILSVERDARVRERRRRSYIQDTGSYYVNPSVWNLFTRGRHWGWLISIAEEQTRGKMDLQDELGDILELWMESHQNQQERWQKNGVFLSVMDGSYTSRDNVFYQLMLLGWTQDEQKWCYAFSTRENQLALLRKVEELSGSVCAFINEEVLLAVFHGSEVLRRAFEMRLDVLLQESGCRCGVSPAFADIFQLPEQSRLAQAAQQYGRQDVRLCRFADAALPYAMTLLRERAGAWLPHPALGTLRAYDAENGTDFCHTFAEYLRCERSLSATAQALGVHRNTLLYRIGRIQELTGLDTDDAALRFHLLLSLALEENVET